MRALVKTAPGPGHLELKDWPEPEVRPGQVKLAIAACGICGTDLHIIQGRWLCRPPVVLGHEWCGTVLEAGAGVRHLQPGDRVVASNPAEILRLLLPLHSRQPVHVPRARLRGIYDRRRICRLPVH